MKLSISLNLFFIILFSYSNVIFSQIKLTLPILSGEKGEEVLASVTINDSLDLKVSSYQIQINYDPVIIKIYDTVVKGTLSSYSGTTNYADTTNGILRLAWASPDNILCKGILLKLKIKFKNYGTSKISFAKTGTFPNGNIFTSMIDSENNKIISIDGLATCNKKKNIPNKK